MTIVARLTSSTTATAVAAVLATAIALAPGYAVLIGWDEWILAAATTRWAAYSVSSGNLYDTLVPTGYPYPPLFFWFGGILCHLFEPNYLIVRIPSAISIGASAGLTALLGHWAAGRWGAWTAGLLAAVAIPLNFHETVSLDYPMTAAILFSLWLLLHALDRHSVPFLCGALLAAGLACAFKYYAVLYLAWLVLAIAIHPQTRMLTRGTRRPVVLLSAALFPAALAVLDGMTLYFYGPAKTHAAETLRTLGWVAVTPHPLTGDFIRPGYGYYPQYLFVQLGIVVCVLIAAGLLWAPLRRNRAALWLLAAGIAWALCAELLGTKHARYLLPAVYVAFVAASLPIAALASTRDGRLWAVGLFVLVIAGQSWLAAMRTTAYLEHAQRTNDVYTYLRNEVPADTLVAADDAAYQKWDAGVLPSFPQSVATPEEERAQRAGVLVTRQAAFDLLALRPAGQTAVYVQSLPALLDEWTLVLDVGAGRDRVRVLQRPVGESDSRPRF